MTSLYYCMGGGLGHITRFIAFCRHFAERPALITNCQQVQDGRIKVDAEPVLIPGNSDCCSLDSFVRWVENAIERCRPKRLIVDAFPGGILGELCEQQRYSDLEFIYLARILDLPAYRQRLTMPLPKFTRIYRLEPLGADQENWLQSLDVPVESLTLPYHRPERAKHAHTEPDILLPDNCWLIIHSGNLDELEQLWLFAQQTAQLENANPAFVMVSPGTKPEFLPADVTHFDIYPANDLLQQANRVFSAAGFNIMQQMRQNPIKHHVLPMPRALDDQFLRYRLSQHDHQNA